MSEDKFDFEQFFFGLEKKRNYELLTDVVKKHKEAGFDLEEVQALVEGHFDKSVVPLVKLWVNRIWKETQSNSEENGIDT